MEPIIAILLFALPFLLYFMFKKIFIKYFTWVYNKTDVNPISVPRQLLGFVFYLPVFIEERVNDKKCKKRKIKIL